MSLVLYLSGFLAFILIAIILILSGFIFLPLFYGSVKICCRFMMASLLLWPKIRGEFPSDGTYIIMMNHSSFLDVFIFPLIPKGAWTGITAVENFKIPVFSSIIKRIQAIPIERKNRQAAFESIKKAEDVLKQGIHIGILPEGTRPLDGKMRELKKGGFHMAINTNTAILPVGVSGAYSFKPKDRWWMKPGSISINIGAPTNVSEYSDLGINGLKNKVETKIKELLGESHEIK
ncbi:MAG: 1-acyl-sn-glycerol-3-phosphate acyltransferase [Candidatus Marinimicrobia bacterium]|nr:1-acyl-sn-glycerol-3-phosphate acyltransferase [Candidatus Neomarinimicrobiota bacterium]